MSPNASVRFSNCEAAQLTGEHVAFSFGDNWRRYAESITVAQIEHARRSLRASFAGNEIIGHDFIDLGSGSGLFSYGAFLERARSICSIDIDPQSVATTARFREHARKPQEWAVRQGSILDDDFRTTLPLGDRVYSWGVLHHTGAMWTAIEAALELVVPGGLFCLALYTRPRLLPVHLALKRTYNRLPRTLRPGLAASVACAKLGKRLLVDGENPVTYVRDYGRLSRGMSFWHDIEDWLGGVPFEYAYAEDVERFVKARGFEIAQVIHRAPGANNEYLLRRVS